MVINDTANTENVFYRSSGGRLHQFVILIIASLALIVGVMLPALSIEQQFWIVLLPIGVLGLSHGGADPMILKKLTATSPTGLFVVLCVYLMASLAFGFRMPVVRTPQPTRPKSVGRVMPGGCGLDRTAIASGIRILFLYDSQRASFPFDCRTPLVVESKKPVPGVSGP